ncbi:MAG: amidohydrolase family protein [Proteobacteria bacterium]|nr:amidohydrolase family protein [Pseudomonadota bacterium]
MNGLCLLPEGEGHKAAPRHIVIREGRIDAIVAPGAGEGPSPGDEVIRADEFLILPGLVNAHTHSPDNLIRGSTPNLPLELWSLHSAAGREARSTREIRIAALLGAIEMLHTGTTTVLDHIRFSPAPDPVHLDVVAEAYREVGIRAVIAPIVADRPVIETMPLDAADLPEPEANAYGQGTMMPAGEQVGLVEDFISRWHGRDDRIYGAIGPSGPQRCTDALLELAGDLSRRRDVLFHTHVLETRAQREMGHRLYGCGIIRHLKELQLLSSRANLVHAIWLEENDLDTIAESGAAVVHNPVSNAKLGSGLCRLPELLGKGIRIALGTDSACCNDSNNLLETAKWAALLHNVESSKHQDWVGPERALVLATRGGAGALGLGQTTGAIATGLAADLTLFRRQSPSLVPLLDPVRQIVQCESGAAVDTVFVNGRIVLRGGRCTLLDEAEVWREAQDLAERRLSRNAEVYASAARLSSAIERMYARIDRQAGTR